MTARTSGRAHRGWLGYAVMAAIALSCLFVGTVRTTGPYTTADRINAVAKTIKCPTCQGESVADSNAPASREIRADIAERLSRGETPDQIRASYASVYDDILLTPSRSGLASTVWILPVVVFVAAAAGLVVAFRRWRGGGAARATDADRARVAAALAERGSDEDGAP